MDIEKPEIKNNRKEKIMKMLKKLAGFLMTVAMVFSMTVSVFAANDSNGVTDWDISEHTFSAYQVFAGDYSEGTLSNVVWGTDIDSTGLVAAFVEKGYLTEKTEGTYTAAEVAEMIGTYADYSDGAYAIARIVNDYVTGDGTPTAGNTFDAGYYLVVDTTDPLAKGDALNLALLQVKGNDSTITAEAKTNGITIDKKIGTKDSYTADPNTDEDAAWTESNTASIGDTLYYELVVNIPNMTNYTGYSIVMGDTLSEGLTYTDNMTYVLVDAEGAETTLPASYVTYADVPAANTKGGTISIGMADIKPLQSYKQIKVYYTAVINESAKVGVEGNPNTFALRYNNNPNDKGNGTITNKEPNGVTGTTPDEKTLTYTTEVEVDKVDGNGNVLTGAEFTLTGTRVFKTLVTKGAFEENADGEYWKLKDGTYTMTAPVEGTATQEGTADKYDSLLTKYALVYTTSVIEKTEDVAVKAFVGEDGKVKFTGLGDGTYTLTETETPAGYNTIAPITVTVASSNLPAEVTTGTETITWTVTTASAGATASGDVITVVNEAGSTLPTTGGMGTTLFYAAGTMLVLVAGVLLVARKRMAE